MLLVICLNSSLLNIHLHNVIIFSPALRFLNDYEKYSNLHTPSQYFQVLTKKKKKPNHKETTACLMTISYFFTSSRLIYMYYVFYRTCRLDATMYKTDGQNVQSQGHLLGKIR